MATAIICKLPAANGFTGKPEVPEGELQPNHEQQQGHAQLGQKIKRFSRRDYTMTDGPARRRRGNPARRVL